MRIGRTLPPAASPIGWKSFRAGLIGMMQGQKEVDRFASELKDYFDRRHCFLVSSGKGALTLTLLALKEQYPERNEVIIPAYTCYSVPSAIVRAGLVIKLCDLAENSFDFDFEQLSPMLKSDKLLAVLPTHLFGMPADVKRLKGMITTPEVTVIEDAAQAMGAEWQGEKLGTLGNVGFFSLGRGKAFSTVEGGVILTDNDELAQLIKLQMSCLPEYTKFEVLKLAFYTVALNILLHPALFWIPKGLPFLKLGETLFDPDFSIKKMTAFQAGLAKNWDARLHSLQQVRQKNTKKWSSLLHQAFSPFFKKLDRSVPDLIRFPVLLADRGKRMSLLENAELHGLGVAIAYPVAISSIPECTQQFTGQDFPVAKRVARELVTLPVHPFVTESDIRSLVECFNCDRCR
jgi:perosamine synthetase